MKKWLKTHTDNLSNKTIAITGSTGGVMKFVVETFAGLGANLIFLNRNKEKTKEQIQNLKEQYPNLNIRFIKCDLSDFDSVVSSVKILKNINIDILYLASGAYNIARYKTELNLDNVFQINFFSHYYIVKELLPNLNLINGKVVMVSSIAHSYSNIDENDIDFSLNKKASKVYGNAKKFLMCSLFELMKNHNSTLSIVHPGITLTKMTNHYPRAINWLVKFGILLMFPSNKKASLSLIKGVFENTNIGEWIAPKLFNIWGKPKKQLIKKYNLNESKKIFEIAENLYEKIKK